MLGRSMLRTGSLRPNGIVIGLRRRFNGMWAAVFFHGSNSCCRIWNIPLFGSFRRDRWLDFLHILPWNHWLIILEGYAVFKRRGILRMICGV